MLGLAEYTVISAGLWHEALTHQQQIVDILTPDMTRPQAVAATKKVVASYYDAYQDILEDGLTEITQNAIEYYQSQLGYEIQNPNSVVKNIVASNYTEPYYGATLEDRLKRNYLRLFRNVERASFWGVEFEGLKRILTHPIPYGSQYNLDKRILLAQAAKIEQDTVKVVADDADLDLIKWMTSPLHAKPDTCDDYAAAVDPEVETYIKKNRLEVDPKGVYFVKDLPYPPHPNCRCEYGLVRGKELAHGPVKRTITKIRSLLRRLSRK